MTTDADMFGGMPDLNFDRVAPSATPRARTAPSGRGLPRKAPRPTDDWWTEVGQLPDWDFQAPDLSTEEGQAAYAQASHRAMYHERLNTSKKKRGGKTPEALVTKAGNEYLASIGAKMIRINAGTFKVVDPDGVTTRYISGPPAGTHDWVGCLPGGRFISVEYKATTDPTPGQLKFLDAILGLGGLSLVVRDIDQDLKPAVEAELLKHRGKQ